MPDVTAEEADVFLVDNGTARLLEQRSKGIVTPIELANALGITAQVLYNYIRNGRIKSYLNDSQKIVISYPVAIEFVQGRLSKAKAKAEQIQKELTGG